MSDLNTIMAKVEEHKAQFTKANKVRLMNDVEQVESKAVLMPASLLKSKDFIVGTETKIRVVGGYDPMLIDEVGVGDNKDEVIVSGVHLNLTFTGRRHKLTDEVWILKTKSNVFRRVL